MQKSATFNLTLYLNTIIIKKNRPGHKKKTFSSLFFCLLESFLLLNRAGYIRDTFGGAGGRVSRQKTDLFYQV